MYFSKGQTAFDVSDEEMKDLLDELKKKQASQNKDVSDKNYLISNKLSNSQNQKRRLVVIDKFLLFLVLNCLINRLVLLHCVIIFFFFFYCFLFFACVCMFFMCSASVFLLDALYHKINIDLQSAGYPVMTNQH